ncbi:MAG: ComEC/Rec2 family competence protein [Candidatus Omnitrophica bacterium]|nr:ComEC/Rec2 family competence protein [Candidatus Omnitrophota bacterium]
MKLTSLVLWSLAAIVIGIFLWKRHRPGLASLCLLILVMLLGAFRAWNDGQPPTDSIEHYLTAAPQPITCEGIIISDVEWICPAQGPARRQGWFQITGIRNGEKWISASGQVLLKLHAHNVPLAYGDRVRLSGSIRCPRPALKDEDGRETQRFNERNWLWIHGASGILTIADSEAITRLDSTLNLWTRYRRWVTSFRWQLKQIGRSLLGPLEVAYLEAFLLGDGREIPREVWDAFRQVGVVHVLVVSGLHVGLIASIGLVGLSLIRVSRVLRYHLLSMGLVTYCILTGGNPPILRSTIMGVLLCFGRVAGREVPALNSLGLSAILILAVSPRALADASFQLSFAAVLGLFTLSPLFARWFKVDEGSEGTDPLEKVRPTPESETILQRWRRTLWRWTAQGLAASCGAWVAITPVVAWHFHTFTPIALIANLVVIPWSSLLITVGFLIYATGWISSLMATPFAATFSWLVYGLNQLVIWLAALPAASWKW